jgi:hypothetical protein
MYFRESVVVLTESAESEMKIGRNAPRQGCQQGTQHESASQQVIEYLPSVPVPEKKKPRRSEARWLVAMGRTLI